MNNQETIIVLLATYNGEQYISELLDSIVSQTYTNWKLFIRDDCSSDRTVAIINEYAKVDKRIHCECGKIQLGACKNFEYLLNHYGLENYVMFCDQDDIWDSKKIELTYNEMLKYEQKNSTSTPVIVFCKKQIVDDSLKTIGKDHNLNSKDLRLLNILVQNPIYGCTMMINKKLVERCIKFPEFVQMHDYYCALIAATYGDIGYIEDALIMYRQHSGNVTGGTNNYSLSKKVLNFTSVNEKVKRTIIQNYYYCKTCFESGLKDNVDINTYLKVMNSQSISRVIKAYKSGLRLRGIMPTARLYYVLLFMGRIGA